VNHTSDKQTKKVTWFVLFWGITLRRVVIPCRRFETTFRFRPLIALIVHWRWDWLVFITEMECLLRGTDWIFKYNSSQRSVERFSVHRSGIRMATMLQTEESWFESWRRRNFFYNCFHFLPEATEHPVQWVTLVCSRGVQKVVALLNHSPLSSA
jgi:hypothetical protein